MATLKTYLISGAGNTFHIAWNQNVSAPSSVAKMVCEKNSADGFIFLTQNSDKIYLWDFYNNDGSVAEMCGNATRCVGFFVKNILQDGHSTLNLKTIAGNIQIKPISSDQFEVYMTPIHHFEHSEYFYCDTGVPHIVIERPDFDNYKNLKKYCSDLRFHPDFQPRGTNVTLIQKSESQNIIKAVSYERGVEDFTLACGTGAMAAAFYNYKKYQIPVTAVQMPGGTLEMNLNNLDRPTMKGPAKLLGEFQYENI